jgi:hypothetical protein
MMPRDFRVGSKSSSRPRSIEPMDPRQTLQSQSSSFSPSAVAMASRAPADYPSGYGCVIYFIDQFALAPPVLYFAELSIMQVPGQALGLPVQRENGGEAKKQRLWVPSPFQPFLYWRRAHRSI